MIFLAVVLVVMTAGLLVACFADEKRQAVEDDWLAVARAVGVFTSSR